MTCERRYTESAISEMHAIAAMNELRRRIQRLRDKRMTEPATECNSCFIDALDIVLLAMETDPVSSK
jgi:hypothetical protein